MAQIDTNVPMGFNFGNYIRNEQVLKPQNIVMNNAKKTGTTIVGLVCKDCVILAADSRATGGSTVAMKKCQKLHYMAPNIFTAGAGTAADCDWVTKKMEAELTMTRLNSGKESRVSHVYTRLSNDLVRYGGYIGAYLIIAGCDASGKYLVQLSAEGNYIMENFCSMGSGSLAAIGILERGFRDGLTAEEGIKLACDAIIAGATEDLGSGSHVNAVIVRAGKKYEYRPECAIIGRRENPKNAYHFKPRNIPILKELTHKFEKITLEEKKDENKMDLE